MTDFDAWARLLAQGDPALAAGLLSLQGHQAFGEYRRTRQPQWLDQAIAAFRAAIDASPAGTPERVARLANYAAFLETRYSDGGGPPEDLDTAISRFGEALDAAGPGDPNRAGMLSNLGTALLKRFERDGKPGDLDEAIAEPAGGRRLHPAAAPQAGLAPVQSLRVPAHPLRPGRRRPG